MAHVAQYKKDIVKEYVDLISKYPIVGTVNMVNLPAQQLQKMREQARGKVVLRMSRKRLMKIAVDQAKENKKGIDALSKHFEGMPALVFSEENPFKLFKLLSKNKISAPAKAGQVAPNDIVIKPGPTSFAPGPIISELGSVGLKVGVEAGKVAVKEECLIVKKGEVINEKIANILMKLGEKPMEVGLDLTAVYEKGTIFTKDILDIDEEEFLGKLSQAGMSALNLAMEIGYSTKETVELLISKAANDAKALAVEANIPTTETISESLGTAERESQGLKEAAGVETVEKPAEKVEEKKEPEEPKVEVKEKIEEPKIEEPKVEVKKPEEEKPVVKAPKDETDRKVQRMVQAVKEHATGEDKKKSAEVIVTELKKEDEIRKKEEKEKEELKEEVPKAEDLAKKKAEQQKDDVPTAEELAKKKAEKDEEQAKAEELFDKLKKKGTLRDK